MTLTEFNQNPSRATRLARHEDVVVTDHGVPTFELRLVAPPRTRIDELRRAGLISPARSVSRDRFPTFGVPAGLGATIIRDYEADEDSRDW